MTTQQIADNYYELAKQNKWVAIQETYHDENVVSREPDHVSNRGIEPVTAGKKALIAKGDANRLLIQEIHSQECSKPLVAGNFFTVTLKRDITFKNKPRMSLEEVGVFEVKDGKIIEEIFFY